MIKLRLRNVCSVDLFITRGKASHIFLALLLVFGFYYLCKDPLFPLEPNAPGNLTVLYRTGRSLTVNWDAPAVGTLTGYSVTLSGNGTIKTQTIGNDTTTSAFTGLTAGTEYTVGVVTVSGDQQSADEVNNTFYTSK